MHVKDQTSRARSAARPSRSIGSGKAGEGQTAWRSECARVPLQKAAGPSEQHRSWWLVLSPSSHPQPAPASCWMHKTLPPTIEWGGEAVGGGSGRLRHPRSSGGTRDWKAGLRPSTPEQGMGGARSAGRATPQPQPCHGPTGPPRGATGPAGREWFMEDLRSSHPRPVERTRGRCILGRPVAIGNRRRNNGARERKGDAVPAVWLRSAARE